MSKQKKKKTKWIKPRHYVIRFLLAGTLGVYTKFKYGVKVEPFKEQKKGQPYLILYNHQTAWDQFFVGLSFKGPVYYLASEDIFSMGWVSGLIRWLVEPIPIKKQSTDIQAVKTCYKVAKEGGTIAIAPEGNRTYSGKTEYMSPAIAGMAKTLKMPIALYRIEGGFGVHPRWSDVVRKGKMRGYVSRVIEVEEYKDMTTEELFAEIERGLYVNEAVADREFSHKQRAEYLERAMYVCPDCGLSTFYSKDDVIWCTKCNRKVRYGLKKELIGVDGEFPYPFVSQWYDAQKAYVNSLDVTQQTEEPYYREEAELSEVILYKHKEPLRDHVTLALYGDRLVIDEGKEEEMNLAFGDISAISVLGKNKLNIYYQGHVYQIKSDEHFNALKYVNIYYRYKNISKGESDDEFLGL